MSNAFVSLARTIDLKPGNLRCVRIQGRRILLANVEGRFYATDDTCTHEDASLSLGVLKGEWVKCPLHGSQFNVRTGEVMEEPAEEPLKTYPVRIEGDTILIDLS
ncbi:MAG TPA: non-heme iron oxygenase ferredoxin subunit [Candidatus Competibacteraceae bacterium]|nr:non-heme iron oxygenase ferredoxin subunit [Candidatus Competibacteraceae bacterium]